MLEEDLRTSILVALSKLIDAIKELFWPENRHGQVAPPKNSNDTIGPIDVIQKAKGLIEVASILASTPCVQSDETSKKSFSRLINLYCAKLNESCKFVGEELTRIHSLLYGIVGGYTDNYRSNLLITAVNHNLDYNTIAQQFMSINAVVDWIDAYRPGVYKNSLYRMEKCIVDHLTEVQHLMKDASLSLDDASKIVILSRFLEQFRKRSWITLLQLLPRSVRQQCDEIRAMFKERLSIVLSRIRQSCEVKEDESRHGFDCRIKNFSCSLIARYFNYVDCCMKSPIVRADASLVRIKLEMYTQEHFLFIEQSASNAFNTILNACDTKDQFETSTLLANRMVLSCCLREIASFEQHQITFHTIDRDRGVRNNLTELFRLGRIKLSIEMDELIHHDHFRLVQQKITIARYLSVCDGYLVSEKCSFESLYQQYQRAVQDISHSIHEKVRLFLKTQNYRNMIVPMKQLQQLGDSRSVTILENVTHVLCDSINRLMNEALIITTLPTLSLEQFTVNLIRAVHNLQKIEKLEDIVTMYSLTVSPDLKEKKSNIVTMLTEHILRFMRKVDALVAESTDCKEAYQQGKEIQSMTILLGRHCPEHLRCKTDQFIRRLRDAPMEAVKHDEFFR